MVVKQEKLVRLAGGQMAAKLEKMECRENLDRMAKQESRANLAILEELAKTELLVKLSMS